MSFAKVRCKSTRFLLLDDGGYLLALNFVQFDLIPLLLPVEKVSALVRNLLEPSFLVDNPLALSIQLRSEGWVRLVGVRLRSLTIQLCSQFVLLALFARHQFFKSFVNGLLLVEFLGVNQFRFLVYCRSVVLRIASLLFVLLALGQLLPLLLLAVVLEQSVDGELQLRFTVLGQGRSLSCRLLKGVDGCEARRLDLVLPHDVVHISD